MKKKYLILLGVAFLFVTLGGIFTVQQVKHHKFNDAYKSYLVTYYKVVTQVTEDTFSSDLTDPNIENDIRKLNDALAKMGRYETEDIFMTYYVAYDNISNLNESIEYAEKWEELSNLKQRIVQVEFIVQKTTFLAEYEDKKDQYNISP